MDTIYVFQQAASSVGVGSRTSSSNVHYFVIFEQTYFKLDSEKSTTSYKLIWLN